MGGFSNLTWSKNPQTSQDEENSFSEKNYQDEESSKEQDLFFSPIKSISKREIPVTGSRR
jgi:hypothetical protein